ncbi:adenylate/guanylate cyclase domain-containing protein, partial [Kitasatospora sp. NPDC058965]
ECALLAAGLAEPGAGRPALPRRLLDRAGGNPLHLEHLLAAARETGSPEELPATVQALLGARIDALGPEERLALDVASVIGREFAVPEVARLADRDPGPVRSALLRLGRRRLVEPAPGPAPTADRFRFAGGLVHEVAYGCVSKRARSERHERAAGLASVRSSGDGAVGGHLERAHRLRTELGLLGPGTEELARRAAELLGRAGAQALARSDLAWAEDLLDRALALSGPDGPVGPGAARRLGEARLALGRGDAGRALLRQVRAAGADPVETAHARLALAVAGAGPESPPAAARAVLPVFEAARDELGQARACLRIAQDHQVHGRHGAAERLLDRALSHAVRADGEPERAAALGAVGISLWRGPQPVPAATARCRELLAAHGPGRRTVRVTVNCPLAVLLALPDEPRAARARLAEAGRLAAELGYAEAQVFLPVFGAEVEALAGRPRPALELLAAAARAARQLGADALLTAVTLESARLLVELDRPAAAAERLAAVDVDRPRPHAESAALAGLRSRIAAAAARPGEALRLAGQAVRAAALTDSPIVRAVALLDRAHALLLAGHRTWAAAAATSAGAQFAAKGHRPGARGAAELADRARRPRAHTVEQRGTDAW